jgi:hypothetical protein
MAHLNLRYIYKGVSMKTHINVITEDLFCPITNSLYALRHDPPRYPAIDSLLYRIPWTAGKINHT